MIENAVVNDRRLLKLDDAESQKLHCVLRDHSTLTQALARLSSFFTEQDSNRCEGNQYIEMLINDLLKSAMYATRLRFDHLQMPDRKLVADFIEV